MSQLKISIRKPRAERLLDAIRGGNVNLARSLWNQNNSTDRNPIDCKLQHPLNLAIAIDSLEMVLILIEQGIDLDLPIRPLKKQTALHYAVIRGNKEIVMTILQRTANWQVRDNDGATVLHLALESKRRNKIEILKIFLDLGMDVDVKNHQEETPLFVASKYKLQDVVDFLLERGANIDAQDCNGDSVIHFFLKNPGELAMCSYVHEGRDVCSNAEFMKWLICKGADPDCKNKSGQLPLDLALQGAPKFESLILLEYVKDSSYFTDETNRTILHSVLKFRNRYCEKNYNIEEVYQIKATVEVLLERQVSVDTVDCDGNTILHVAANEKKFFILPKLLEHFKDVNARNHDGDTALHIILDVTNLDEHGLENLICMMLSKGASMYLENKDGLSPIHLAAKKGHLSILKLFKEKGADLKICTANAENLWHIVVSNYSEESRSENMIRFLNSENLDVNATTLAGLSPLHIALRRYDNNEKFFNNETKSIIIEELIKNGANVNLREGNSQMMPIHIAIQNNNIWAVQELIQAKADVNAKVAGTSALHLAARHSVTNLSKYDNRVRAEIDVMKYLIRAGADVDAIDESGHLSWHYLIENNKSCSLTYLQELEVNIRDCCSKHSYGPIGKCFKLSSPINYFKFSRVENNETRMHHCLREVEKMKALQIDYGTTFCDFLRLNLTHRMIRVAQGSLEKIIKKPNLESEFPIYYDLILRKYREALIRKPLLVLARSAFAQLISITLPDVCVDNILCHLKNHNLNVLIRASELPPDCTSDLWTS